MPVAIVVSGMTFGMADGLALVADAQWHESAFAGAVAVHLCYFLFFADYAAAAEAEKMADHAGRVEKWGQDRYQRWPARNDH